MCAVLAHTHAACLVHRDLKPANVLLRIDGTVSVIDFGVAALTGASRLSTLTASGAVVGTAEYQAPERRLGVESPLTDLFAVGRVLRDLATATEQPAAHSDLRHLIDELTAERPQDRPSNAWAVGERLAAMIGPLDPLPGFVADPRGATLRVVGAAAPVVAIVHPPTDGGPETARLWRRAEQLAGDERLHQAIKLADYVIDVQVGTDVSTLDDLRWSRARWLVDAGDYRRAVTELSALAPELSQRLGRGNPTVVSARFMLARACSASGAVNDALAVLDDLYADLAAVHGPDDPSLFPIRLELGVQQAVAGERAKAKSTLDALVADQRRQLGAHSPALSETLDVLAAVLARSPILAWRSTFSVRASS
jgi:serine/threonine protein kinase